MTKASALADAILRDRERRKSKVLQKPTRTCVTDDFDPFSVQRWRVVAGGNPGYLPKTPMRKGPIGWFIACGCCAREFESKGWRYCSACIELPAEERRARPVVSDRHCQNCGSGIPKRRRTDAKYCSNRCAKAAANARSYHGSGDPKFSRDTHEIPQQNQAPKNVLIGPSDFPINVIGGYRFPRAKKLSPAFVQSPPLVPARVLSLATIPARARLA
jgi:hypothetical protein